MRPPGSIWAYIASTISAICAVWYALLVVQVPRKVGTHLGYRLFPSTLAEVVYRAGVYNASLTGGATDRDLISLYQNCIGSDGLREFCNDEVWSTTGLHVSRDAIRDRCCLWSADFDWNAPQCVDWVYIEG